MHQSRSCREEAPAFGGETLELATVLPKEFHPSTSQSGDRLPTQTSQDKAPADLKMSEETPQMQSLFQKQLHLKTAAETDCSWSTTTSSGGSAPSRFHSTADDTEVSRPQRRSGSFCDDQRAAATLEGNAERFTARNKPKWEDSPSLAPNLVTHCRESEAKPLRQVETGVVEVLGTGARQNVVSSSAAVRNTVIQPDSKVEETGPELDGDDGGCYTHSGPLAGVLACRASRASLPEARSPGELPTEREQEDGKAKYSMSEGDSHLENTADAGQLTVVFEKDCGDSHPRQWPPAFFQARRGRPDSLSNQSHSRSSFSAEDQVRNSCCRQLSLGAPEDLRESCSLRSPAEPSRPTRGASPSAFSSGPFCSSRASTGGEKGSVTFIMSSSPNDFVPPSSDAVLEDALVVPSPRFSPHCRDFHGLPESVSGSRAASGFSSASPVPASGRRTSDDETLSPACLAHTPSSVFPSVSSSIHSHIEHSSCSFERSSSLLSKLPPAFRVNPFRALSTSEGEQGRLNNDMSSPPPCPLSPSETKEAPVAQPQVSLAGSSSMCPRSSLLRSAALEANHAPSCASPSKELHSLGGPPASSSREPSQEPCSAIPSRSSSVADISVLKVRGVAPLLLVQPAPLSPHSAVDRLLLEHSSSVSADVSLSRSHACEPASPVSRPGLSTEGDSSPNGRGSSRSGSRTARPRSPSDSTSPQANRLVLRRQKIRPSRTTSSQPLHASLVHQSASLSFSRGLEEEQQLSPLPPPIVPRSSFSSVSSQLSWENPSFCTQASADAAGPGLSSGAHTSSLGPPSTAFRTDPCPVPVSVGLLSQARSPVRTLHCSYASLAETADRGSPCRLDGLLSSRSSAPLRFSLARTQVTSPAERTIFTGEGLQVKAIDITEGSESGNPIWGLSSGVAVSGEEVTTRLAAESAEDPQKLPVFSCSSVAPPLSPGRSCGAARCRSGTLSQNVRKETMFLARDSGASVSVGPSLSVSSSSSLRKPEGAAFCASGSVDAPAGTFSGETTRSGNADLLRAPIRPCLGFPSCTPGASADVCSESCSRVQQCHGPPRGYPSRRQSASSLEGGYQPHRFSPPSQVSSFRPCSQQFLPVSCVLSRGFAGGDACRVQLLPAATSAAALLTTKARASRRFYALLERRRERRDDRAVVERREGSEESAPEELPSRETHMNVVEQNHVRQVGVHDRRQNRQLSSLEDNLAPSSNSNCRMSSMDAEEEEAIFPGGGSCQSEKRLAPTLFVIPSLKLLRRLSSYIRTKTRNSRRYRRMEGGDGQGLPGETWVLGWRELLECRWGRCDRMKQPILQALLQSVKPRCWHQFFQLAYLSSSSPFFQALLTSPSPLPRISSGSCYFEQCLAEFGDIRQQLYDVQHRLASCSRFVLPSREASSSSLRSPDGGLLNQSGMAQSLGGTSSEEGAGASSQETRQLKRRGRRRKGDADDKGSSGSPRDSPPVRKQRRENTIVTSEDQERIFRVFAEACQLYLRLVGLVRSLQFSPACYACNKLSLEKVERNQVSTAPRQSRIIQQFEILQESVEYFSAAAARMNNLGLEVCLIHRATAVEQAERRGELVGADVDNTSFFSESEKMWSRKGMRIPRGPTGSAAPESEGGGTERWGDEKGDYPFTRTLFPWSAVEVQEQQRLVKKVVRACVREAQQLDKLRDALIELIYLSGDTSSDDESGSPWRRMLAKEATRTVTDSSVLSSEPGASVRCFDGEMRGKDSEPAGKSRMEDVELDGLECAQKEKQGGHPPENRIDAGILSRRGRTAAKVERDALQREKGKTKKVHSPFDRFPEEFRKAVGLTQEDAPFVLLLCHALGAERLTAICLCYLRQCETGLATSYKSTFSGKPDCTLGVGPPSAELLHMLLPASFFADPAALLAKAEALEQITADDCGAAVAGSEASGEKRSSSLDSSVTSSSGSETSSHEDTVAGKERPAHQTRRRIQSGGREVQISQDKREELSSAGSGDRKASTIRHLPEDQPVAGDPHTVRAASDEPRRRDYGIQGTPLALTADVSHKTGNGRRITPADCFKQPGSPSGTLESDSSDSTDKQNDQCSSGRSTHGEREWEQFLQALVDPTSATPPLEQSKQTEDTKKEGKLERRRMRQCEDEHGPVSPVVRGDVQENAPCVLNDARKRGKERERRKGKERSAGQCRHTAAGLEAVKEKVQAKATDVVRDASEGTCASRLPEQEDAEEKLHRLLDACFLDVSALKKYLSPSAPQSRVHEEEEEGMLSALGTSSPETTQAGLDSHLEELELGSFSASQTLSLQYRPTPDSPASVSEDPPDTAWQRDGREGFFRRESNVSPGGQHVRGRRAAADEDDPAAQESCGLDMRKPFTALPLELLLAQRVAATRPTRDDGLRKEDSRLPKVTRGARLTVEPGATLMKASGKLTCGGSSKNIEVASGGSRALPVIGRRTEMRAKLRESRRQGQMLDGDVNKPQQPRGGTDHEDVTGRKLVNSSLERSSRRVQVSTIAGEHLGFEGSDAGWETTTEKKREDIFESKEDESRVHAHLPSVDTRSFFLSRMTTTNSHLAGLSEHQVKGPLHFDTQAARRQLQEGRSSTRSSTVRKRVSRTPLSRGHEERINGLPGSPRHELEEMLPSSRSEDDAEPVRWRFGSSGSGPREGGVDEACALSGNEQTLNTEGHTPTAKRGEEHANGKGAEVQTLRPRSQEERPGFFRGLSIQYRTTERAGGTEVGRARRASVSGSSFRASSDPHTLCIVRSSPSALPSARQLRTSARTSSPGFPRKQESTFSPLEAAALALETRLERRGRETRSHTEKRPSIGGCRAYLLDASLEEKRATNTPEHEEMCYESAGEVETKSRRLREEAQRLAVRQARLSGRLEEIQRVVREKRQALRATEEELASLTLRQSRCVLGRPLGSSPASTSVPPSVVMALQEKQRLLKREMSEAESRRLGISTQLSQLDSRRLALSSEVRRRLERRRRLQQEKLRKEDADTEERRLKGKMFDGPHALFPSRRLKGKMFDGPHALFPSHSGEKNDVVRQAAEQPGGYHFIGRSKLADVSSVSQEVSQAPGDLPRSTETAPILQGKQVGKRVRHTPESTWFPPSILELTASLFPEASCPEENLEAAHEGQKTDVASDNSQDIATIPTADATCTSLVPRRTSQVVGSSRVIVQAETSDDEQGEKQSGKSRPEVAGPAAVKVRSGGQLRAASREETERKGNRAPRAHSRRAALESDGNSGPVDSYLHGEGLPAMDAETVVSKDEEELEERGGGVVVFSSLRSFFDLSSRGANGIERSGRQSSSVSGFSSRSDAVPGKKAVEARTWGTFKKDLSAASENVAASVFSTASAEVEASVHPASVSRSRKTALHSSAGAFTRTVDRIPVKVPTTAPQVKLAPFRTAIATGDPPSTLFEEELKAEVQEYDYVAPGCYDQSKEDSTNHPPMAQGLGESTRGCVSQEEARVRVDGGAGREGSGDGLSRESEAEENAKPRQGLKGRVSVTKSVDFHSASLTPKSQEERFRIPPQGEPSYTAEGRCQQPVARPRSADNIMVCPVTTTSVTGTVRRSPSAAVPGGVISSRGATPSRPAASNNAGKKADALRLRAGAQKRWSALAGLEKKLDVGGISRSNNGALAFWVGAEPTEQVSEDLRVGESATKDEKETKHLPTAEEERHQVAPGRSASQECIEISRSIMRNDRGDTAVPLGPSGTQSGLSASHSVQSGKETSAGALALVHETDDTSKITETGTVRPPLSPQQQHAQENQNRFCSAKRVDEADVQVGGNCNPDSSHEASADTGAPPLASEGTAERDREEQCALTEFSASASEGRDLRRPRPALLSFPARSFGRNSSNNSHGPVSENVGKGTRKPEEPSVQFPVAESHAQQLRPSNSENSGKSTQVSSAESLDSVEISSTPRGKLSLSHSTRAVRCNKVFATSRKLTLLSSETHATGATGHSAAGVDDGGGEHVSESFSRLSELRQRRAKVLEIARRQRETARARKSGQQGKKSSVPWKEKSTAEAASLSSSGAGEPLPSSLQEERSGGGTRSNDWVSEPSTKRANNRGSSAAGGRDGASLRGAKR
ncbi:ulk kinase [Cystoisospora suis]|uniref:Ulk kinase n=1 Tax=Cystoisospora suis TaxID=483139 RepID=A0A2C6LFL6_9APIC|nr:ulk kinase [Cystoisospora suis]